MYSYDAYTPRSIERFIITISSELKNGNNVILRVPFPNLNREFISMIQKVVRDNAGPELDFLDASLKTDYKSLLSFLNDNDSLNRHSQRRKNIQSFFSPENGHYSVICVTGLDSWSEAAQKNAARELSELVNYTREQNRKNRRAEGRRFLVMVSPLFPLPPEGDGLSVMNWWGVTSPADHEYFFEECVNESKREHTQDVYWWLKSICFAVGGDDPDLIRNIVETVPLTLNDIEKILLNHPLAKNKKLQDSYFRHLLFRTLSPDPGKPPSALRERQLWSQGLLAPNRYGLYHPVMLTCDVVALEKTLAMGQREVFFPLVDQVHAFISFIVEEKIGTLDYLLRNDPNQESNREKMQMEISVLNYILIHQLRYTPQDFPELQNLINLGTLWTRIRHINAHVRMLPYEELKNAISSYDHMYQSLIGYRQSHNGYKA
jgi:hypothetical protein